MPESNSKAQPISHTFPIVIVTGVPIASIHLPELLAYFKARISNPSTCGDSTTLIAYANAHSCNLFNLNREYRQAMLAMDLIYADGNGPRIAAWLKGQHLPSRMAAADWIWDLCEVCAQHSYSLFLLGGVTGVAERAAQTLREMYPELVILGTHHGFAEGDEEQRLVKSISILSPDIVVLGMGSPQQELWMLRNHETLSVPIVWGTGGLLDFVSGNKRRSPRWMRALALEWLGRVLIEPRRLLPRYLVGIPLFLALSIWSAARFHLRNLSRQPGPDTAT
jgi:exopolysaccharide biosynthesis WecB/TagA/CpsF family protein